MTIFTTRQGLLGDLEHDIGRLERLTADLCRLARLRQQMP
jgi:hypothetical protein